MGEVDSINHSGDGGVPWLLFEILLAIGVERLVNTYFPSLHPYVWLAILVGLTYKALATNSLRRLVTYIYSRWGVKHKVLSYLIVALLGAFLITIYWWGVNKSFAALERRRIAAQADEGAKPPLDIAAYLAPDDAPYPSGTLGGIQWDEKYTDVRVDLKSGPVAIQNLDLAITLDTNIAAAGQLSSLPNVTILPPNIPPVWLGGTDEKGNPINHPVDMIKSGPTSAHEYRVHCAQLFSDATLRLIIAAIAVNPPSQGGGLPMQLFAPKQAPQLIEIKGGFETSNVDGTKRYPINFSQRFTPPPGLRLLRLEFTVPKVGAQIWATAMWENTSDENIIAHGGATVYTIGLAKDETAPIKRATEDAFEAYGWKEFQKLDSSYKATEIEPHAQFITRHQSDPTKSVTQFEIDEMQKGRARTYVVGGQRWTSPNGKQHGCDFSAWTSGDGVAVMGYKHNRCF